MEFVIEHRGWGDLFEDDDPKHLPFTRLRVARFDGRVCIGISGDLAGLRLAPHEVEALISYLRG